MGGLFLEELFGRNYLFYFDVEGIDLFVKIFIFVKILSQRRRKDKKFRSLEVRRKYIALKNIFLLVSFFFA